MFKELQSFTDCEAVRKLQPHESYDKSRILRSRWILTDKNASLRTSKTLMPLRAKARLVVGGHRDPDVGTEAAARTDAPTADVLGINLLMMMSASLKWELW